MFLTIGTNQVCSLVLIKQSFICSYVYSFSVSFYACELTSCVFFSSFRLA